MKKTLIAMVGVLLLGLSSSQAAFKFDLTEGFNFFGDSRVEGQNRHVGIMFDLSDGMEIGLYVERADLQLTGDVGATPPNFTKLNFDAQAIRVMKGFGRYLSAGLDLGSAKIQQGANAGFGAIAALNQNKPFVGILGKASYSANVKDKLTADMHLTIGYRYLDLNDVALGVVGESTVDDLNALIVGLGVGFKF